MGFSYVLGGGGETVAATATRMLEKFVDATQQIPPPALWQRLAGSLNRLGRGTGYVAIGAIDLAAWDLWAKCQKITLAEALGGVPRPVKVYGSGGFGPTQAPEDAVRAGAETMPIKGVRPSNSGLPAMLRTSID